MAQLLLSHRIIWLSGVDFFTTSRGKKCSLICMDEKICRIENPFYSLSVKVYFDPKLIFLKVSYLPCKLEISDMFNQKKSWQLSELVFKDFSLLLFVPLICTAARPQQVWAVGLMCMLITQHCSAAIILVQQPAFYRVQRGKGITKQQWGDNIWYSCVRDLMFALVNCCFIRLVVLKQELRKIKSTYSVLLLFIYFFNGGKEVRHYNLATWLVNLPGTYKYQQWHTKAQLNSHEHSKNKG